jgi:hypothetical protein
MVAATTQAYVFNQELGTNSTDRTPICGKRFRLPVDAN